jgi:predicted transposase YbfD/YdcC
MFRLIEKLKKVKDFRQASGKRHQLWVVLLIIILGIMQSYIGYRAIGDFAKYNQALLTKYFKLPGGKVPSYSTIRRVLMELDLSELLNIFNEWAKEEYQNKEGLEWIAVDGKSLRSTVINHDDATQNFVMFASFFSQETGIVLHLEQWENKESSEIHQVQDMIRDTELTDKNFTLDALHSNRVTPQEIIDSNNDYLITLKANQLNLYKHVEEVTKNSQPVSVNEDNDRSHGRDILRLISVFNVTQPFNAVWEHIKSYIKVERYGEREGKEYYHSAYYISSLVENAQTFAEKIRGHWKIENQLHWVKDVIFKEDTLPFSDVQAVSNLSILQTIALNLFRGLGFLSITQGQRWLDNRWFRLCDLLE